MEGVFMKFNRVDTPESQESNSITTANWKRNGIATVKQQKRPGIVSICWMAKKVINVCGEPAASSTHMISWRSLGDSCNKRKEDSPTKFPSGSTLSIWEIGTSFGHRSFFKSTFNFKTIKYILRCCLWKIDFIVYQFFENCPFQLEIKDFLDSNDIVLRQDDKSGDLGSGFSNYWHLEIGCPDLKDFRIDILCNNCSDKYDKDGWN